MEAPKLTHSAYYARLHYGAFEQTIRLPEGEVPLEIKVIKPRDITTLDDVSGDEADVSELEDNTLRFELVEIDGRFCEYTYRS